ncbi:HAD family hydrolase [Promethearchaeum syntrophicum]|uniref:HAD family hydrolase n=1 Tax=Promethearchaeum syntrophicum TaxID=2594042 RepID=A0A5B9DHJ8_9ARCH|nr:HAD hydrolase-like protein [Candidatus Prometheoarchaeum syntrophicum]QEE18107.1 fructose-1-P/6-phosphogluconate phosphatase [Candidatus Prometheoarchaeum syntrophicum]
MSQNHEQIGIIFDLDGTLLDSRDFFLHDIPQKIADHYGVEFSQLKQEKIAALLFEVFGGQKGGGKFLVLKVMWKVAKKFGVPWFKRINFLRITQDMYRQGISNIPLIEGVENTLVKLSENYNVIFGINTTGSYAEVFDRFKGRMEFLVQFSDNIISRDKVKYIKPSPEGIKILSKKWNIPMNRIIMVGDMKSDIVAGKSAGAITIGVTSGFYSKEMMEKVNPDLLLTDISQIPDNMELIMKKCG